MTQYSPSTIFVDDLLKIMDDLERNGRPYEDRWYALKQRLGVKLERHALPSPARMIRRA